MNAIRLLLFSLIFFVVASCAKKGDDNLVLKLIPEESLVLEMDAYSCFQIVEGIHTPDGGVAEPSLKGPVVLFNRFVMQWKKNTKLYIHQAKLKFRGAGIQGGEATCDLTGELASLMESSKSVQERAVAYNPADTTRPPVLYNAGTFYEAGRVTSSSDCRIACPITLANSDRPEISASGELTVKASEITNEGTDSEKYYRVKSQFRVRVTP